MKKLCISALAAIALTGCSSAPVDTEETQLTSGSSICADVLTVKGKTYQQWTMANNLERDLVGSPIRGTQNECDEGETSADAAPDEVTLRRIAKIPGKQALAQPAHPAKDVIYVRGDEDITFEELPKKVRRLIKHG